MPAVLTALILELYFLTMYHKSEV